MLIFGLKAGLTAGLAVGLISGLTAGLTGAIVDTATVDPNSSSSQSPASSWRSKWNYTFLITLTVGLAAGIAIGLGFWLAEGLRFGLGFGLAAGLAVGLVTGQTWPVLRASAQIANNWHTPVRLMRFLEDAYSRNVLRTVGSAYQFRHARLQDRLAAAASFREGTLAQVSQANDQRLTPATVQHESAVAASPSSEPGQGSWAS